MILQYREFIAPSVFINKLLNRGLSYMVISDICNIMISKYESDELIYLLQIFEVLLLD